MNKKSMTGRSQQRKMRNRIIIGIIVAFVLLGLIASCAGDKTNVLDPSANSSSSAESSVVPWDYKIEQSKVGDLIGGDMTLQPNNQMLPNDNNYATGDNVWVLSFMTAEMKTASDGKNDVTLSAWTPLKTFKTEKEAKTDMDQLKLQIETEVDLIGVYKTQYESKERDFAVVKLPSGHNIKQPISKERYAELKDKKRVKVVLEEVHDFSDYDLAMSKFRGWAN
ncbi:hypothetical protein [Paenibacillus sp. FJAT-26967]|uniref:hypothetical protein n=1 Tax=Paenibacillus sp. FJAT-26967 TaxID=1729690 RepID=UPI0008399C1E|nr:hypothetical protein [Paenibacillus sp. FJAT-26967]